MFNVAGKNAIDSAKDSRLYDVLVYASEKKDMDEIIQAHYDKITNK